MISTPNNSERFLLHLRGLLETRGRDARLVQECMQELQTPEVLFHPGGEVSTLQVYHTCVANQHHAVSSSLLSGEEYQHLLDVLHQEQAPAVRFISITTRAGSFLLFTDVPVTRIIGILPLRHTLENVRCMAGTSPCDFLLSACKSAIAFG